MQRATHLQIGILVLAVATALAAGGSATQKEPDDGVDVYFRDVDLGALSPQPLEQYIDAEPGESKVLDRAFPGAPPQIPHTVEDMLPITGESNECLDCHLPENATAEEDIPMSKSHFEVPILGEGGPGEPLRWKVKGYQKRKDLAGARFNCTMCHTPQALNVKTPKSRFVRERLEKKRKRN